MPLGALLQIVDSIKSISSTYHIMTQLILGTMIIILLFPSIHIWSRTELSNCNQCISVSVERTETVWQIGWVCAWCQYVLVSSFPSAYIRCFLVQRHNFPVFFSWNSCFLQLKFHFVESVFQIFCVVTEKTSMLQRSKTCILLYFLDNSNWFGLHIQQKRFQI